VPWGLSGIVFPSNSRDEDQQLSLVVDGRPRPRRRADHSCRSFTHELASSDQVAWRLGMIRHVVMFWWTPEATDDQKQRVTAEQPAHSFSRAAAHSPLICCALASP
jgi:hypothetical protein